MGSPWAVDDNGLNSLIYLFKSRDVEVDRATEGKSKEEIEERMIPDESGRCITQLDADRLETHIQNHTMLNTVLFLLDQIEEDEYYGNEDPYLPLNEAYDLIEGFKKGLYGNIREEISKIIKEGDKE